MGIIHNTRRGKQRGLQISLRHSRVKDDNSCTRLHRENAFAVKYLCLILCVTPEHVGAAGLEIPGSNQDHIPILDPGPSLHLASYAADAFDSV